MAEDYYHILGVAKNASHDEIKKAYRKLSKQFHPDLNPNNKEAEEKFKKINEAYSVVGDESKRKEYDNPVRQSFDGGFPGGFDFFSEFFSNNFGFNRQRNPQGQQQQQQRRGQDLRLNLMFTIEDVINGSTKTLRYQKTTNCSSCNGNGSKNGNSFKSCSNCGGKGFVNQVVNTPFGRIQNMVPCNVCSSTGRIIHEMCTTCGGRCVHEKQEHITLNIPAGITDGFTYRIESAGNSTPGIDKPGDLIVVCVIQEDPIYKRVNGLDLHRDVFISLYDAIVGTDDMRMRIFDEEIRIRIEPNTENGKILRMKGKGLPNQNGGRGDLFLHINVFVPKDLDEATKESLRSIKEKISPENKTINYDSGVLSRAIKFGSMYLR